jgi:hypothetical protein
MAEMKKWVVQYDAIMVGTDNTTSFYGTETQDQVENMFQQEALDWFDSFGHEDLMDDDGEINEDWLEDRRTEVSPYAELYDPDKHDGLLHAKEKWAWERN